MSKVAIIGSRDFADLEMVRRYVATLPADTVVVSGGARGVDRAATTAARARGLEVEEIRPEPVELTTMGRGAFLARNLRIVASADAVAAFWDGQSHGTADAMRKARRLGVPVHVFRAGGPL